MGRIKGWKLKGHYKNGVSVQNKHIPFKERGDEVRQQLYEQASKKLESPSIDEY